MASKIDVSGLTLNAKEAEDISKLISERVFVQTPLAKVHDIQTGVQMAQQIVFVDNLDVGGEALTNCVPVEQDGLTMTEKFWAPALVAGRFTHCANNLDVLLKIFKKAQRVEPDFYDRIESQEIGILMAKVIESLRVSISAKVWLGDKTAAVQAGGNFTISDFNVGWWNQIEGLWEQIFTAVGTGDVPRYTIPDNAEASYVAQILDAGESETILKTMYENADSRLLGAADAQYLITRSIWDNMLTFIESKQYLGGIISRLEDGQQTMSYRGIPVIKMPEWDRTIRKFQDDLTVHYLPHRAVLTTPGNIPIATLSEGDLQNLESFYDKKDKTNIIDYGYYVDTKLGEGYLTSVAY